MYNKDEVIYLSKKIHGVIKMAYSANPAQIFTAYTTDTDTAAVFDVASLPSCSGNPSNLQDIKEVLFSILSVVEADYSSLPAYSSGVALRTKANNFSITSSVGAANGDTVRKTFTVGFTVVAPPTSVLDEPNYTGD